MSDNEIDTSDIPPLTNAFFSKAKLRKHPQQPVESPHICIDAIRPEKQSESHA
jgi:hypothetical protein